MRQKLQQFLFCSLLFLFSCKAIYANEALVNSVAIPITGTMDNLNDAIKTLVIKNYNNNQDQTDLSFDTALAMHYAITQKMLLLHKSLEANFSEDSQRQDKDKKYILANSFTSFMYIMIAIGEYAVANDIKDVNFASIKDLVHLLVEHNVVGGHPSFDEMMSTLHAIHIEAIDGDLKITLTNQGNKTVKVKFSESIPSPRFEIYAVMIENGATFVFSELNAKKNIALREAFIADSQKGLLGNGVILMDERKSNIPEFLQQSLLLEEADANAQLNPVLVSGEGFAGKGHIKGFKLPSPTTRMERIYLLPGRDGTPAFVRAKTLGFNAFVAL